MRESVSALKSVLLPTLGSPTIPQRSAMGRKDSEFPAFVELGRGGRRARSGFRAAAGPGGRARCAGVEKRSRLGLLTRVGADASSTFEGPPGRFACRGSLATVS